MLRIVLLISGVIFRCISASTLSSCLSQQACRYHNHEETFKEMQDLEKQFPDMVRIYSIGKSANNLELHVLELTSALRTNFTKRNVHLMGSIFGDEPVGREILLNLAHYLLTTYNKTKPQLLDVLRIHILPAMNPDGAEVSKHGTCQYGVGRRNLNGQSLDADFPLVNMTDMSSQTQGREPETQAVMYWMQKDPAVLTVTLRAGGYVVTYPYETRRNKNDNFAIVAPDDDILQHLARIYAQNHVSMRNSTICNRKSFVDGVLNGAQWKKSGKVGGIQDYVYSTQGSMHLNVAITCCRHPKSETLPQLWKENQTPLIALLVEATGGLDGVLREVTTNHVISGARLTVAGRNSIAFYSANFKGTFSRILLPGSYILQVKKEGYEYQSQPVTIEKERKIYVGNKGFSTKVAFIEIFLETAKESTISGRGERKDIDNIKSHSVDTTTRSEVPSTPTPVFLTHLPQSAPSYASGVRTNRAKFTFKITTIVILLFICRL